MFSRLVIIGVGLLGGSIGLAARKRNLADEIIGVGRSERSLESALRLGVVDTVYTDLKAISLDRNGAMIVTVCTPVGAIPENVLGALDHWKHADDLLVTDVGSTKATLCHMVDDPRFIGSHPIAGSEQSGPEAARADLFQHRTTILTPTSRNLTKNVDRLRRFWETVGSIVVEMDADRHDEILAVTSHLPHLVSVALAATLRAEERPFGGTGYADMTRLAAGPTEVWRDIFSNNRENVLLALRRFEKHLSDLSGFLESNDVEQVGAFLERVRKS